MQIVALVFGLILVALVLAETFETMVLPRGVVRRVRFTRMFYVGLWRIYRCGVPNRGRSAFRESYLSIFGPLSLLLLIILWALILILGFGMIQFGLGSHLSIAGAAASQHDFMLDIYMSGTTFFTLGLGDVTPMTASARAAAVLEAGVGFGFLAVVIGYVPVIYTSFSRREVGISLLDARAGSPPNATELLLRHARGGAMEALTPLLATFEQWASDLMESHLSYPVLAYYRSQHDRESWLSALTAILDVCALIEIGFDDDPPWQRALQWQAKMTFAMARHAIVDLSFVFIISPVPAPEARLDSATFACIRRALAAEGLLLCSRPDAEERLAELRAQYEPFVYRFGDRVEMPMPPWIALNDSPDNWQMSLGTQNHL